MSRLPPSPDLTWKDDGTPVATAHDDVYFSADDGLSETRAVFLAACNLPERWAGRTQFTVAETGFGTGLNFLTLWQMWREHRPSPDAQLNFVSFEGFPLKQEAAVRALAAWPELAPLATRLTSRWPHGAKGVRRLHWPQDGISLTLHIGDIADTLPASSFRADAWFLDGFSPAKNADMWEASLYKLIAERSRPGARLGTFTVAGNVRRGLTGAGFTVSKVPGHGRKRERLEASIDAPPAPAPNIYGLRPSAQAPKRIAILGAGIAGANAARALLDHGASVTVFDPAPAPASAASGNPMGLVMPRIDAADTVQARLLIDAYISAREAYRDMPGVIETEVSCPARDADDANRILKILRDPPLPPEDLGELKEGGLLHRRAMIVRPHELIPALLKGAHLSLGAPVKLDMKTRTINGQAFDAVILASGAALGDDYPWLGLTARLGQVEYVNDAPDITPSAIASRHYALAHETMRLWGASFEAHTGGPPPTSEAARKANESGLKELAPDWLEHLNIGKAQSRAGLRGTTNDFLPLIGPLPDEAQAMTAFAGLKTGRRIDSDAPLVEGLYISGGFGSRGFTWGPWAANILAAQLFAAPVPAETKALQAVSPMRIILRSLKRGG